MKAFGARDLQQKQALQLLYIEVSPEVALHVLVCMLQRNCHCKAEWCNTCQVQCRPSGARRKI